MVIMKLGMMELPSGEARATWISVLLRGGGIIGHLQYELGCWCESGIDGQVVLYYCCSLTDQILVAPSVLKLLQLNHWTFRLDHNPESVILAYGG